MKFYVVKHPEKGYLRSKAYWTCTWSETIEFAKKWSFKNHVTSMLTQAQRSELKKCQVEEIHYWIGKEIE